MRERIKKPVYSAKPLKTNKVLKPFVLHFSQMEFDNPKELNIYAYRLKEEGYELKMTGVPCNWSNNRFAVADLVFNGTEKCY